MPTPLEGKELGRRIEEARARAGFSQDEVALLTGQPRPVVSNWENGRRRPNAQQLTKLAAIFRVTVEELLGTATEARPEFEKLFFRDAGDRLTARGKFEVQQFLRFLDAYAELREALAEPPLLSESPFSVVEAFTSREDIRRKAADARAWLNLGTGPIGNLLGVVDLAGITVYMAPLGADLTTTVSGAFLPHDRVGFSILVNAETTPGRRQFTLAHELAHALFHGTKHYISYYGRREGDERFADSFASEFLVPTQALRSAVESLGVVKVQDPEVAVYLQRLFRCSYAMTLVRLRAAGLSSPSDVERLRSIQPVHLAERMGSSVEDDEWGQDPDRWGLSRFPRRFLRLLLRALSQGIVSIGGAAAITGLAGEDIEELMAEEPLTESDEGEFDYFTAAS